MGFQTRPVLESSGGIEVAIDQRASDNAVFQRFKQTYGVENSYKVGCAATAYTISSGTAVQVFTGAGLLAGLCVANFDAGIATIKLYDALVASLGNEIFVKLLQGNPAVGSDYGFLFPVPVEIVTGLAFDLTAVTHNGVLVVYTIQG